MAEENHDSILERLRSGESVLCEICKKGFYIPYNTTPDKAHSFNCSNSDCNNRINIDAIIDIE